MSRLARLRQAGLNARWTQRCLHTSPSWLQEDKGPPASTGMDAIVDILATYNDNEGGSWKPDNRKDVRGKHGNQSEPLSAQRDMGREALDNASVFFGAKDRGTDVKLVDIPALNILPNFAETAATHEISHDIKENYQNNHGYKNKLAWLDMLGDRDAQYAGPRVDSNAQLYTDVPMPVAYPEIANLWDDPNKPDESDTYRTPPEDWKLRHIPFPYEGVQVYGDRHRAMMGSYRTHTDLNTDPPEGAEDWRADMIRNAGLALGRNAYLTVLEKQWMLEDLKTVALEPIDLLGDFDPKAAPKQGPAYTGGAVRVAEGAEEDEFYESDDEDEDEVVTPPPKAKAQAQAPPKPQPKPQPRKK